MTLLCAALVAAVVLLVVPGPAGRALGRRLAARDVDPSRPNRRASGWLPAVLLVVPAELAGWTVAGGAGMVVASAAAIGCVTLARLLVLRRRGRTAATARAQVAHACRVLAGQLRVGRIPADAVRVAAADCPVLATAAALIDLGSDPVRHWRAEADRPGCAGLLVLARAWSVSTRTGAPLAPALERVAEALSADLAVERLVSGEMSAARATGKIMAALPICGIGLGYLIGGRPLRFLVAGPAGWACLLLGVTMAAIGMLWIDALARSSGEPAVSR